MRDETILKILRSEVFWMMVEKHQNPPLLTEATSQDSKVELYVQRS